MITQVPGHDNIFRGPRLPLTAEAYLDLKARGVTHIINLEDDQEAVRGEIELAERYGMEVIEYPMSEIRRPYFMTLHHIVSVLSGINNNAYYVHCLHGQDRTGYVIAALRILIDSWSFKAAYQEAKDMGHRWYFAPYLLFWPKSLRELEVKR